MRDCSLATARVAAAHAARAASAAADQEILDRLFTLFDVDGSDTISFKVRAQRGRVGRAPPLTLRCSHQEFSVGLSLLMKGTLEEKLNCTFPPRAPAAAAAAHAPPRAEQSASTCTTATTTGAERAAPAQACARAR